MRIYVHCSDGHVRHEHAYQSMVSASQFANNGHGCTDFHTYDSHPDDCVCDWCEQEREQ